MKKKHTDQIGSNPILSSFVFSRNTTPHSCPFFFLLELLYKKKHLPMKTNKHEIYPMSIKNIKPIVTKIGMKANRNERL